MGHETEITIKDGDRIVILGGGPAGSFMAFHLFLQAKKAGKEIRVTIVDKRMALVGNGDGGAAGGFAIAESNRRFAIAESPGCNSCAGIVSPQLQQELRRYGIELPESVLCQRFSHIWIHGLWKNFPLKVPVGQDVVSVFRGTLPGKRGDGIRGLDAFLMKKAVEAGAELVTAEALDIEYTSQDRPCLTLKPPAGEVFKMEADFACICSGVNAGGALFHSFQKMRPGFAPPVTRPAMIFELNPGARYLKKVMDRELYIFVSGSETLDLDHAALIPKGDHLTVALIGKSIDRALFSGDTRKIVNTFLSLPGIQDILPGIEPRVACSCTPLMAVSPARNPYARRIGLAGDAFGARLYRDGLYSAFVLAHSLARTVIHRGVDEESLSGPYERAGRWIHQDNTWAKRVMGLVQLALKSPLASRVMYQTFATEMKFKSMDRWPMGKVLWKIGSGAGDYRKVFRDLLSGPVILSLLRGSVKTMRNRLTEEFFGLNWEAYGRYPTVILRDKRRYIKEAISKSLDIMLDPHPEVERMYAIKIRASADAIFRELGRFGTSEGKFLRLRFVDVKRVSGDANREGAVVRYRIPRLPLAEDIRLGRSVEGKSLLYEPSGRFTRRGRLLFDITPTRDGNNRLVIYTAFDYKRGGNPATKLFWKGFRHLFPDYAHDVVWNHAICCIKAEAEKRERESFGQTG